MMKPKAALVIGGDFGKRKPYDAPEEEMGEESMFMAPKGMEMDGKKTGDTMEAVCTLEVKDGGMLCVRKVNGMDVPGYEDKEKMGEDKMPSKDTFTDAAMPEEGDMGGGDEKEAM